ncbi:MAG TPA: nuclear transport factor 2 family protein, partial [Candidatus Aminicenantes bacterium]|nr:nuclear transport factor 2 family protein [Candidatus Aminicenantes bacterium]
MATNEETVREFWRLFDEADYDKAGKLMKADAVVWWPNTREVFRGAAAFMSVNRNYPGRWRASVERVIALGDEVISVTRVESEDTAESFYATSFIRLEDGLIREITEYWGDDSEPPAWRSS